MRRRWALLPAVAALAVSALGGTAPVAAADATADAVACTLVSPAQLRSIVGLSNSVELRNHDSTVAISEAVNTQCAVGAWSGPTPTTPKAVLQTAKSGRGAQVGIETWAPNDGSPNVDNWLNDDYDKLTGGFMIHSVTFPGLFSTAGWPARALNPPHLGDQARGFKVAVQGLGKGLVAAIGCWWDDNSSSAICLFDEEAAGKPVVKHLNQLAEIAVPKFLG